MIKLYCFGLDEEKLIHLQCALALAEVTLDRLVAMAKEKDEFMSYVTFSMERESVKELIALIEKQAKESDQTE